MTTRGFLALLVLVLPLAAGTARLEKTDLPPLRRIYALPEGRTAREEPEARRARVAGRELILVDVDGDGTFDGRGVDGWTLPGVGFLFPVEDRIVVGAKAVALRVRDDTVEFDAAPAPAQETAALLADFNRRRMRHGLAPLALDARRTRGCRDHVAYMDRHGITRTQDPAHPEYSPAGAEAAQQALVMRAAAPPAVTNAVFRSFPNRIWLFHPRLDRLGAGVSARHIALDIAAPLARRPLLWPVLLPAPNSEDNPTGLYATKPTVFDGAASGLPITLQFPTARIHDVTAELRRNDRKGKAVDVFVGWPERPAHPAIRDNAESICVIPKHELRPGTTYFVLVRYTHAGKPAERSWTFRTGGGSGGRPKEEPAKRTLKESAPLRPQRLKRPPLFFYEPGAPAVPAPAGRRATLARHQVVFVDLDGNGRFSDLGTDGWMLRGNRYVLPLEERIVLGDQEIELVVEPGQVRFTRSTVPVRKRYRKALVRWNAIRKRHGLPPATFRLEFCKRCESHARYMDLNGMRAREDPAHRGYTEEGDRVGRRAAIVGLADLDDALDFCVRRFGGSRVIFSPHAWEAGVGAGGANAVLDPIAKPRRRAWRWPVIVPAPEREGSPVASAATTPVLFPDVLRDAAEVGRAGAPIMLFFEEGQADFDNVEAELREGGPNGKRADVLIAWPKRPAYRAVRRNYHAILVLPRKRLRKRTRYDVVVRTTLRGKTGEHRWWFRTGRGR
ncbi:MAG: CAP domain-containing protein [Planctomycetota bacterium]